jgi:hypothetical protein
LLPDGSRNAQTDTPTVWREAATEPKEHPMVDDLKDKAGDALDKLKQQ